MYLCYAMEERLDKLLVQLNLVETRAKAEKLILEVGVHVNGKLVNKPGKKFEESCKIKFVTNSDQWLSINANKLISAIKKWKLEVSGGVFCDVFCELGSSSEVLFSNKAKKVYLNDLTKDSFDSSLSTNNIVNLTDLDLRELTSNQITEKLDGCIVNSSDQPLSKTLPFIHPFLKSGSFVIAIIKPKIEVDKSYLKNNGEVRNSLAYPSMFDQLKKTAEVNNLSLLDYIKSPILGDEGREEYILFLKKML
jgi:23S rRNA (cytidine1920-2'-O)/16S rRNA (cytidine1409-2'-O)-methyltransferase